MQTGAVLQVPAVLLHNKVALGKADSIHLCVAADQTVCVDKAADAKPPAPAFTMENGEIFIEYGRKLQTHLHRRVIFRMEPAELCLVQRQRAAAALPDEFDEVLFLLACGAIGMRTEVIKVCEFRIRCKQLVYFVNIGPLPPLRGFRQAQAHLRHLGILLLSGLKRTVNEANCVNEFFRCIMAALLPAVPCPLRLIDWADITDGNSGVDIALRDLRNIVGEGLIAILAKVGNKHVLLAGVIRAGHAIFRHG